MITIIKTTLTLALTIASVVCFGQKDKFFHSEEEAKAVHPDSVYKVYLENFEGTSLPEWLFKYKNIEDLSLCGMVNKISPLNNLNGISKFTNLRYLSIGFTKIISISDELSKMKIQLSLEGTKITSVRPILEGMAATNGESFIHRLTYFDLDNITNKEELKWFKKLASDGGHNWSQTGGKLKAYFIDHHDVKDNLAKLKEFLNSTK